jgi:hypothetical protein
MSKRSPAPTIYTPADAPKYIACGVINAKNRATGYIVRYPGTSQRDPLCRGGAFDQFCKVLDATTVPAEGGGRIVDGIPAAIALSEATDDLYRELFATQMRLFKQHGRGVAPTESESPSGIKATAMGIGGSGADAVLVAALEIAARVAAFPAAKWNAMQAARPGANHPRFHAGDVVPADDLARLESAAKLLRMKAPAPAVPADERMATPGPTPTVDDDQEPGEPKATKREQTRKWLTAAMMEVQVHPDWSDAEIARRVGKSPGTLSRSTLYRNAASLARGSKTDRPKGYVEADPDSGTAGVEAVALDHDHPDRGKRIPGSNLFREYCDKCDERIRVARDKVGKKPVCEECA